MFNSRKNFFLKYVTSISRIHLGFDRNINVKLINFFSKGQIMKKNKSLSQTDVSHELEIQKASTNIVPHLTFHRRLGGEKNDMLKEKILSILAITGSTRIDSSNTALLRAAAELGIKINLKFTVFTRLKEFPIFDFNDDAQLEPPPVVSDFRNLIKEADGVLFASPEYVHSIPGGLKNALDWVVSSGEFANKPVALIRAFERSEHVHPALAEVIRTMGGLIFHEKAAMDVPLRTHAITTTTILSSEPKVCNTLTDVMIKFRGAIIDYELGKESKNDFEEKIESTLHQI